MYFSTKNYLKSNHYYTVKDAISNSFGKLLPILYTESFDAYRKLINIEMERAKHREDIVARHPTMRTDSNKLLMR